ncbi:MAG: LacI family DNA-binding transcriptional regulator [Ornithinimicrobium sp.]
MSDRPTLEQVAVRAGVSRATVSRVVRHEPTVDPEIVRAVTRAVDDLGYVPNAAARSLMTGRSGTVALIAIESDHRVFGDPFFASVVRGVCHQLSEAEVQLTLLMAHTEADIARLRAFLTAGHVDGAMVISEHQRLDVVTQLGTLGVPIVMGGRPIDPEAGPVIFVDHANQDGAWMAARRLLDRGCRCIGTVAGPQDMSAGVDRLLGFEAGLGQDFRRERVECADFSTDGGQRAAEKLLDREPDIDGLFVASDLMALGAFKALRHRGLRVPEDVALVGFDDNDVAAAMVPGLTTIRQRTGLQGRLMARLLLNELDPPQDREWPDGVHDIENGSLVLDVELVVRDSG